MSDFIDYSNADLTTLLSDKDVQQLLEIAESYPDLSITDMLSRLALASSHRRSKILSYKQATTILRRFSMETSGQRRTRLAKMAEWEKTSKSEQELLSNKFPDFALYVKHRKLHREQTTQEQLSQDITSLLSEHSVQQLLDIAHEHPTWTNKQIFENQPKNADGIPTLSFVDVLQVTGTH